MKLGKCPKCGEIIDLDEIEVLTDDTVVGCGLKEDDFETCDECAGRGNPIMCKAIRDESGWTQTTVKDYKEKGLEW